MTERWASLRTDSASGVPRLQAAFECDQCYYPSVGIAPRSSQDSAGSTLAGVSRHPDTDWSWFPRTGVSPDFPDVPEHIGRAAKEAHSCSSIGSYMSAILMARTVVEASAKEKEILTGTLYQKIDALREAGLIRAGLAEAAHAIRLLGNDMAHGDIADKVEDHDAADVLQLMDQLLHEIFQSVALVERIRARSGASPRLQ